MKNVFPGSWKVVVTDDAVYDASISQWLITGGFSLSWRFQLQSAATVGKMPSMQADMAPDLW